MQVVFWKVPLDPDLDFPGSHTITKCVPMHPFESVPGAVAYGANFRHACLTLQVTNNCF